MRFMQRSKDSLAKWLSAILPVVIVGLVGLFAVTVIRDYGRETAAARQTLLEKGSVLIRALESGSRVGMGMRMHHAQQQALLEEMAGQPGVRWFAVTDEEPRQPGGCKLKTAPVRPVVAARPAEYVCSEDLFY
ncbi:hypothetical protein MY009_40610 [Escherichia coli]|nr:hypothetical protein MY009_40610 [Escherichia coli]